MQWQEVGKVFYCAGREEQSEGAVDEMVARVKMVEM
jgi:hypothetical protein